MAEIMVGYSGIEIRRDVPAQMRDGVVLRADTYQPTEGGPFPVLLMRLPYNKTEAAANIGYAHPAWYASRGYKVVIQDVRGRFASEGDFYPFLTETEDGYDTIEWAAKLPGSNGRVGMYGFSYAGATQLLPARLGPPSLTTICPGFTPSQYYEGHLFNQGAFSLGHAASWSTLLAQDTARRKGDNRALSALQDAYKNAHVWFSTLPLKAHPPLFDTNYSPYYFDWIDHPKNDEYWSRWSIENDYNNIQVPALHIGGWYDAFISGVVKNYRGLSCGAGTEFACQSQKLLVGPWYHMPWHPLSGQRGDNLGANVVDDWQIRWFDSFLKDQDTGVLNTPVTVFVMGDTWRDFDGWPPSNCQPVNYFLHSEGRANTAFGDGALTTEPPQKEEIADIYTYSPLVPNLSSGGHSCCRENISPMGPADQSLYETSRSVLVYTGPYQKNEIELVGEVEITLYAASSAVDTDFAARLCIVDQKGKSTNIQEGIIRARFRNSLTNPTLITPGKVYAYHIFLGPVCVQIPVGSRIRLDIASSDFPQWDRNLNTGGELGTEEGNVAVIATQAIYHTAEYPSRITLPLMV